MIAAPDDPTRPTIIGRSSSLFTRVARIFAVELGVDCGLQVVRDLMSADPADYGGNPALKLPSLRTQEGLWFGTLNICRALSRRSRLGRRIVWPEDLVQPLPASCQEMVLHAMATEVALIMARVGDGGSHGGGERGGGHQAKLRSSLLGTMAWLDENAARAVATLPPARDLSYLEVTLFCLVTHLQFRDVLPTAPYPALNELCRSFAARPSAAATGYCFDAP
jgi:glutathione S-transferase